MGDVQRRETATMALILVIDDSSFQRREILNMVQQAGYATREAVDGQDGLDQFAAAAPDCLVVDLLMPKLGGLELLEELKDQGSQVPVIILVTDIQEAVRQQCLKLGAAAVVTKPVTATALIPAIGRALDQATA